MFLRKGTESLQSIYGSTTNGWHQSPFEHRFLDEIMKVNAFFTIVLWLVKDDESS